MSDSPTHRLRGERTVCGVPVAFVPATRLRRRWTGVDCPECLSGQEQHEPPSETNAVHNACQRDEDRPEAWRGLDFGKHVAVTTCGVIVPGNAASVDFRDVSCPTCIEAQKTNKTPTPKLSPPTSTFHVVLGTGRVPFRLVTVSTDDRSQAEAEFRFNVSRGASATLFVSEQYEHAGEGPWEALLEES